MKQIKRCLLISVCFLFLSQLFAQETPADAFLARTDAPVSTVAWSPDGNFFATGWGNSIILWDANTNTVSAVWAGHTAPVVGAKFSADGQWLLSISEDNSVIIRNIDEKVSAIKVTGDGKYPIRDATFMDNGYSVMIPVDGVTTTHCFRLVMTNQFIFKEITSSLLPVVSLDVSKDFSKLLVTTDDGTVQLYSLTEGREIAKYPRYAASGIGAQFSPDGTQFLAAADKTSLVVSPVRGSGSFAIRDSDMPVHAAVYSPDGKKVASALENGMIRVYNVEDGTVSEAYSILVEPDDVVESLTYSPDGEALLAGTRKGYIFRWWITEAARGRMVPIQKTYEDKELRKLAEVLKDKTVVRNARTNEEQIAYEIGQKIIYYPDDGVEIAFSYNTLNSDYYWGALGVSGSYRTYQLSPMYFGGGAELSAGGPNSKYPYEYSIGGKPWLYSAGIYGLIGLGYYNPHSSLLLFSELRLGGNVRVLFNNDFTYYHVSNPSGAFQCDILMGAQWDKKRVSIGMQYDSNLGMLFKITAGVVIPIGVKQKAAEAAE